MNHQIASPEVPIEDQTLGEHDFVLDPVRRYEYCSKCGLLEWHAGLDSVCSGIPGVADEANQ